MKRILSLCAVVLFTAAGANLAFAFDTAAAGGWVPYQPADAPFINHGGWRVWNGDGSATHSIQASLEIRSLSVGNWTAGAYGRNNGLTQSCFFYAVNTGTGSVTSAGNSTSVNGNYNYFMTVNIPTFISKAAISAYCQLPHSTGVVSELWGMDGLSGPT